MRELFSLYRQGLEVLLHPERLEPFGFAFALLIFGPPIIAVFVGLLAKRMTGQWRWFSAALALNFVGQYYLLVLRPEQHRADVANNAGTKPQDSQDYWREYQERPENE